MDKQNRDRLVDREQKTALVGEGGGIEQKKKERKNSWTQLTVT